MDINNRLSDNPRLPLGLNVPKQILDERVKSWSKFFEKYSMDINDASELNLKTLQPMTKVKDDYVLEQRLPMRNPISSVQYWVDTGKPPCLSIVDENYNSPLETSLSETEVSPSLPAATSPFGHNSPHPPQPAIIPSEVIEPSLSIVSSGSVNTRDYILSSNIAKKKMSLKTAENVKLAQIAESNNNREEVDVYVDVCGTDELPKITPDQNIDHNSVNSQLTTVIFTGEASQNSTFLRVPTGSLKIEDVIPSLRRIRDSPELYMTEEYSDNLVSDKSDELIEFDKECSQFPRFDDLSQNSKEANRRKLFTNRNSPVELIEPSISKFSRMSSSLSIHPALQAFDLYKHQSSSQNKRKKSFYRKKLLGGNEKNKTILSQEVSSKKSQDSNKENQKVPSKRVLSRKSRENQENIKALNSSNCSKTSEKSKTEFTSSSESDDSNSKNRYLRSDLGKKLNTKDTIESNKNTANLEKIFTFSSEEEDDIAKTFHMGLSRKELNGSGDDKSKKIIKDLRNKKKVTDEESINNLFRGRLSNQNVSTGCNKMSNLNTQVDVDENAEKSDSTVQNSRRMSTLVIASSEDSSDSDNNDKISQEKPRTKKGKTSGKRIRNVKKSFIGISAQKSNLETLGEESSSSKDLRSSPRNQSKTAKEKSKIEGRKLSNYLKKAKQMVQKKSTQLVSKLIDLPKITKIQNCKVILKPLKRLSKSRSRKKSGSDDSNCDDRVLNKPEAKKVKVLGKKKRAQKKPGKKKEGFEQKHRNTRNTLIKISSQKPNLETVQEESSPSKDLRFLPTGELKTVENGSENEKGSLSNLKEKNQVGQIKDTKLDSKLTNLSKTPQVKRCSVILKPLDCLSTFRKTNENEDQVLKKHEVKKVKIPTEKKTALTELEKKKEETPRKFINMRNNSINTSAQNSSLKFLPENSHSFKNSRTLPRNLSKFVEKDQTKETKLDFKLTNVSNTSEINHSRVILQSLSRPSTFQIRKSISGGSNSETNLSEDGISNKPGVKRVKILAKQPIKTIFSSNKSESTVKQNLRKIFTLSSDEEDDISGIFRTSKNETVNNKTRKKAEEEFTNNHQLIPSNKFDISEFRIRKTKETPENKESINNLHSMRLTKRKVSFGCDEKSNLNTQVDVNKKIEGINTRKSGFMDTDNSRRISRLVIVSSEDSSDSDENDKVQNKKKSHKQPRKKKEEISRQTFINPRKNPLKISAQKSNLEILHKESSPSPKDLRTSPRNQSKTIEKRNESERKNVSHLQEEKQIDEMKDTNLVSKLKNVSKKSEVNNCPKISKTLNHASAGEEVQKLRFSESSGSDSEENKDEDFLNKPDVEKLNENMTKPLRNIFTLSSDEEDDITKIFQVSKNNVELNKFRNHEKSKNVTNEKLINNVDTSESEIKKLKRNDEDSISDLFNMRLSKRNVSPGCVTKTDLNTQVDRDEKVQTIIKKKSSFVDTHNFRRISRLVIVSSEDSSDSNEDAKVPSKKKSSQKKPKKKKEENSRQTLINPRKSQLKISAQKSNLEILHKESSPSPKDLRSSPRNQSKEKGNESERTNLSNLKEDKQVDDEKDTKVVSKLNNSPIKSQVNQFPEILKPVNNLPTFPKRKRPHFGGSAGSDSEESEDDVLNEHQTKKIKTLPKETMETIFSSSEAESSVKKPLKKIFTLSSDEEDDITQIFQTSKNRNGLNQSCNGKTKNTTTEKLRDNPKSIPFDVFDTTGFKFKKPVN